MSHQALIDRYPGVPGCRLDTEENGGATGPALDLGGRIGGTLAFTLWVRESGTGEGKSASLAHLSPDNIRALRDGCTRLLVEAGLEKEITIAIPR